MHINKTTKRGLLTAALLAVITFDLSVWPPQKGQGQPMNAATFVEASNSPEDAAKQAELNRNISDYNQSFNEARNEINELHRLTQKAKPVNNTVIVNHTVIKTVPVIVDCPDKKEKPKKHKFLGIFGTAKN